MKKRVLSLILAAVMILLPSFSEKSNMMKLNKQFVKHEMDGMTLVVPVAGSDFHGLIHGNKTVGVMLECLEHDTTEKEIADALCERFDGNRATIEADVARIVAQLKELGAIDD